jgi:hypothetical protein
VEDLLSTSTLEHVDVHASEDGESVQFYETVLAPLGIQKLMEAGFRSNGAPSYRDYGAGYYAAYLLDPDGNNVEALYRDVGNVGHGASASLSRIRTLTPGQERTEERCELARAREQPVGALVLRVEVRHQVDAEVEDDGGVRGVASR